ncbi:MAG: sulfite exporter TauE/SafE family protein [Clostridia bacterium]|nr:sulfite exporter TauE/SafE family protein [Clostridia bacterium]
MRSRLRLLTAGALAGLVNGLFGAGGGLIWVPVYRSLYRQRTQQVFATSVAVILPLCAVSYLLLQQGPVPVQAVPYLLGGAAGGLCAGRVMRRLPTVWLRRLFGLFLLYGGLRVLVTR